MKKYEFVLFEETFITFGWAAICRHPLVVMSKHED